MSLFLFLFIVFTPVIVWNEGTVHLWNGKMGHAHSEVPLQFLHKDT